MKHIALFVLSVLSLTVSAAQAGEIHHPDCMLQLAESESSEMNLLMSRVFQAKGYRPILISELKNPQIDDLVATWALNGEKTNAFKSKCQVGMKISQLIQKNGALHATELYTTIREQSSLSLGSKIKCSRALNSVIRDIPTCKIQK